MQLQHLNPVSATLKLLDYVLHDMKHYNSFYVVSLIYLYILI